MMDKEYRFRVGVITPDLKYNHHMEMVEEAWKLFNWKNNDMKKQKKLIDY